MYRLLPLVAVFVLAACGGGNADLAALPEDWTREGNRFWQQGTDTTGLFRDLETVDAMGFVGEAEETDRAAYVARNLKRRLVVLYRNNPEAVDSLFEAKFAGLIEGEDLNGGLTPVVDRLERPATRALTGAFRGPSPRLTLGEDIPYGFPDSLQASLGGARVRLQIALDAEGEPVAIEVLDPVNPTLDQIAVRAATQQRWSPIYVLRGTEWASIPGWVRYNLVFGQPDSES